MERTEGTAKTLQTKKLLATQLMQMLEYQSFKKITVNDICQQAAISRSAFYLHFADKYCLLYYCMEGELRRLETAMPTSDLHAYLVFVLNEFLKKKKFYYNTLVVEPDQELYDLFHTLFPRAFATRLETMRKQGHTLPGPISIVSTFYAGGIVSSTIQWIKNGFDISVEEMAACQQRLFGELAEPGTSA